ncbi:uncharacterized protein LOC127286434 [Leptopilina boulardi]|uniref:uncharacterized protein LOC127286434 n=1 Tax=Leptopilina boulardi TaxID=63433 RepID=UPI0021F6941D|nr:uncharacterized protein LOC127286434 [Leptopilina boulardi]
MSQIQQFYNDQSIFITGGTGFMGKILLEKLLRGLPKLKNIYLLIRPKKGKEIQQRLDEFFKLEIFNPLREKDPFFVKKIIPLNGDVRKSNLGLSQEDRKMLINEVSIVIHAAATTKFDEPLKVAVDINVNSVVEIIKLCRELKKLKMAVYVSTAFIRNNSCTIEEKIYPLPMTYEEVHNTVDIINRRNLSREDEEQFTKLILGNFPNTYIFTKSIAEGILNEEARDLPFCVFRFPIASATYKEPVTGWVDTIQGFNQLMMGLGLGVIHTLLCPDKNEVVYMVPADFVCNALIASIWDTEKEMKRTSKTEVPVYNYVNGNENPLTKLEFERIAYTTHPHLLPTKMLYYPEIFIAQSPKVFAILNFFLHLLPALAGDIVYRIMGKKPIFYKIYQKGVKFFKTTEFFSMTIWTFDNNRIESLWEKLSNDDKELFPFDMKKIDWSDVVLAYWKGVLKYILKDDLSPENRRKAVRRYYILLVIHRTLQAVLATFIIWLLWKIFCDRRGTGFIGKILVEKLLRSLPKIGKIYLLMRPKKGKDIQERFHEYFKAELFDPLREKDPSVIEKVIPLSGDVTQSCLGLSDADRKKLINEVSIVIHSAATTRMNEPLNIAVSNNIYSVLEIIKLCRELKKLKVAVHVSTAFMYSNIERIEEKIYPMPMTYEEVKNAIEIIKRLNLSKKDEKQFTKILLGEFSNTYLFTKAIAEGIIKDKATDLPFCIYRFPIALATYKEPFASWVDVAQGINQGLIWTAMGLIRVILVPDLKDHLYFVPADFVCNALIASAWDAGNKTNKRSDITLPVYNYVNGNKNPLTKEIFEKLVRSYGIQYLPSKTVYFPDAIKVKSKRTFNILNFFVHLLPALIGDIILKILGKKPIFHKFYKKGMKLLKNGEFFLETKWSFDNKNIEELWEKLSEVDKTLFQFDMTNLDWSEVLIEMWKGVLKYILKENITPETEKRSLRRYYTLMAIHRTLQALFVTFIIWLIWKIFCGCNFFT